MKVSIQTLGCKVNQSESASIEGLLRENNYEMVNHSEGPDICIINTCSVTSKSDYQSRQLVSKAVRSGAKVIATGCYAQLKPEEISEIEQKPMFISCLIPKEQELADMNIQLLFMDLINLLT